MIKEFVWLSFDTCLTTHSQPVGFCINSTIVHTNQKSGSASRLTTTASIEPLCQQLPLAFMGLDTEQESYRIMTGSSLEILLSICESSSITTLLKLNHNPTSYFFRSGPSGHYLLPAQQHLGTSNIGLRCDSYSISANCSDSTIAIYLS